MGICWSGVEREEAVSRCRARKTYMKQLVKARQAFANAHTLYLRSLRNTASALLHFADGEAPLHHLSSTTSPPEIESPPKLSSGTWTSTALSSPLPSPPPHPWDFWDPFGANPHVRMDAEKDSSCDLSVIVSVKNKGLVDVVREVDEYFLKACEAAAEVSSLLEVFSCGGSSRGKVGVQERSLSPMLLDWSSKVKFVGNGVVSRGSHCSTLERLYAWEKKLFHEVKGAEGMKMERERKVGQLRKLEVRRNGYLKAEVKKKEVEKLECRMMVAFQAIETASDEIVKLRELELRPQLHRLVKGLTGMWRGMYECHQVQAHIVHQLSSININLTPSAQPTPVIHRQAALQLELEVNQWHLSFCNLMKTQQDYVGCLTAWLRLSIFQFKTNPLKHLRRHDSPIFPLCEEWQLTMDRVPDKVASEGIRSLLTFTQVVTTHHKEEIKQQKRSESAFRDLEKCVEKLGSVEEKFGALEGKESSGLGKRAVVGMLRERAEEEKTKHEKLISVGRMMTLRNLEVGFAHVFQGLTSFAGFCTHAFELVYNKVSESEEVEETRTILP